MGRNYINIPNDTAGKATFMLICLRTMTDTQRFYSPLEFVMDASCLNFSQQPNGHRGIPLKLAKFPKGTFSLKFKSKEDAEKAKQNLQMVAKCVDPRIDLNYPYRVMITLPLDNTTQEPNLAELYQIALSSYAKNRNAKAEYTGWGKGYYSFRDTIFGQSSYHKKNKVSAAQKAADVIQNGLSPGGSFSPEEQKAMGDSTLGQLGRYMNCKI